MGKTGRTQTPAQKAASERNLRKGNPRAYQGPASSEPPADPPAEPAKRRVVRARTQSAKPRAPKPRRVPPRAPARDEPQPRKSGGGFLDGLREGLAG